MEPVIFFAPPPNLDELCGITVFVCKLDQTPFATLQLHVAKCREIMFTEPEILASPSNEVDACFNIIMQQSLFKSNRVQKRLQNQGMQVSKPYRILPSLYQSCLNYTLSARLAPVWNRAGEWLIQGRDFLMHTGYTNAIKLKLCVNKDEMFVSLVGTVVRFPPLQVEDLNLSPKEMQAILKSTEDCVREVILEDCWCHVLPSILPHCEAKIPKMDPVSAGGICRTVMKRGRIISLSLLIPRESPFSSYRDLQRHWKNMYGYRLPETDEDILYCQVGFLPSGGGKHFTLARWLWSTPITLDDKFYGHAENLNNMAELIKNYPSVCLRSGPVQVIQRVDPKPVLTAFLQDIYSRVGTVCGQPLRFQPKLCFPLPSLHVAGRETGKINLSSKPVNKPIVPLRSQKSMSHLYSGLSIDKKTTEGNNLSERKKDLLGKEMTKTHIVNVLNDKEINSAVNTSGNLCKEVPPQINLLNSCGKKLHLDKENVKAQHTDQFEVVMDQPYRSPGCTANRMKPACGEPTSEQDKIKTKINARPEEIYNLSLNDCDEVNDKPFSSPAHTVSHMKPDSAVSTSKQSQAVSQAITKLVPHFRPKPKHQSHIICSGPASSTSKDSQSRSFIPLFKPQARKADSGLSSKNKANADCSSEHNDLNLPSSSQPLTVIMDSSKKATLQDSSLHSFSVIVPHFKKQTIPKIKQDGTPKLILSEPKPLITTNSLKAVGKLVQQSPQGSDINLTHSAGSSIFSHTAKPLKASLTCTPAFATMTFNLTMTSKLPTIDSQDTDGSTVKRKLGVAKRKIVTKKEDTAKKPRIKPQVQDVDVESLARVNQLGKVNTVTLVTWLKAKGVICRSKDKKNDFVEKVYSYINAAKPEQ